MLGWIDQPMKMRATSRGLDKKLGVNNIQETQIEMLHRYGIENPESGLQDKVVGYQLGEKIEVRDPHTHKLDRKPLKPFMVNNSVIVFEKEKMVFDPTDKKILEQFEGYRIKAVSVTGLPTYSDENEHAVDAVNLSLLIMEQKYGQLFKTVITSKILSLNEINRGEERIDSRSLEKPKKDKSSLPLVGVIGTKQGHPMFNINRTSELTSTRTIGGSGFGSGRGNNFSRGRF